MAKGLSQTDINRLARVGAAARLAELEREIAGLRRAFPGLKAAAADVAAAAVSQPKETERAAKRGRRKPMSAAERKAVSVRMKKYWSDRRKSQP